MDAQLVWNTWRRVLTSDELVEWVLSPESRAGDPDGLTAGELAILVDLAGTPEATAQNIGMYRRGLTRNVLGALDFVPLTRRLLYASGLDVEAVATDCARAAGYADHGPNFWQTAAEAISYLATLPEFAAAAQQDVLRLDAATVALARRLGESAPPVWPDSTVGPDKAFSAEDPGRERFVANRAAVAVSTSCDLTPWIVNPFGFDAEQELEPSPRHWLVFFPAAEAAHEYAQLSERAAHAFDLLRTPQTAEELSLGLDGLPRAEVLAVLDSLAGLGVVGREADVLPGSSRGPSAPAAPLPEEGYPAADPLPLQPASGAATR
jgi:hypothetical protein